MPAEPAHKHKHTNYGMASLLNELFPQEERKAADRRMKRRVEGAEATKKLLYTWPSLCLINQYTLTALSMAL